jgi:hypothetical protein
MIEAHKKRRVLSANTVAKRRQHIAVGVSLMALGLGNEIWAADLIHGTLGVHCGVHA